jgi:hypothetical protein
MQAEEKILLVLKIDSLQSSITARRRLAKQPFWGDFQMRFYVTPYERELRELQAQLAAAEAVEGATWTN